MTHPTTSDDARGELTDERLTALEIKASFAEDMLDKLDQTVIRQQTQIAALISEVLHLRQQIGNAQGDTPRSLRDELPPHY
jgi:SlyX protein